MNNKYFKPTVVLKKYVVLNMIEKNSRITQRKISNKIGISVSMVNHYIKQFVNKRYVKKIKVSNRNVKYKLSNLGIKYRNYLNIEYLKFSQLMYNSAKENIFVFLNDISKKGFYNIFLYGAGEVCEIILNAIISSQNNSVNILGIIDDDKDKIGKLISGFKIYEVNHIINHKYDAIIISSYSNQEVILNKLISLNFKKEKILGLF